MVNASDLAFLMKGYLRAGDRPMPLASLFLRARTESVSRVRKVAPRVLVMAAAAEDARFARLRRGLYEGA